MKTRVISAAAGIALLITIMLLPGEVLGIAVFVLALAGIYEFYGALSRGGYRPVKAIGYLSCIPLLFIGIGGNVSMLGAAGPSASAGYLSAILFAVLLAACACGVFLHKSHNFPDVSMTIFGIFYVVFLFSFVTSTRSLENGRFFIWMIFIGAWVTDTCAYFAGITLGRRKLIPEISPKKTVEGSLGGILGCTAAMLAYGVFLNNRVGSMPLCHFAVLGVLCGVVSQIGDLTASVVKRFVKIKDYGNIMPGHGGVLDRLDSILFVAPVVYFYIRFILIGQGIG